MNLGDRAVPLPAGARQLLASTDPAGELLAPDAAVWFTPAEGAGAGS